MLNPSHIAILGTGGAIGAALLDKAAQLYPAATIWGISRQPAKAPGSIQSQPRISDLQLGGGYCDEASLAEAAAACAAHGPLDLVIVATGILHTPTTKPEKSLRQLSAESFAQLFAANTIAPALIAKHFLPVLAKDRPALFAALSARVGSISDNRLGGWYSYRSSKAALNMVIKTAAIEMARKAPQSIVVSLHPGTVDSPLSKPFQANVPKGKLFTPEFCASRLLAVMAELRPADSGRCFAWDGSPVDP